MCIGIGIVKAPRDGDVLVKTVRQEVCFPHHHKTREDDDLSRDSDAQGRWNHNWQGRHADTRTRLLVVLHDQRVEHVPAG